MNPHKETVMAALVTAGVAVMATGLIRRLLFYDETESRPLTHIPASKFGRELLRAEFIHRPNYANCNCGSFGHVPQRIIHAQNEFVKERELDPDTWYRFPEGEKSKYFRAVGRLSEFLGADKNNLVMVENASTGVTTVLRSIKFAAGDKILINSHTYTAVEYSVKHLVKNTPGIEMVSFDLQLPINTQVDLIDQFKRAIEGNPGIRVVVLDHITSSSAILTPVKPIIDWCHERDILVVLDGAHAAGQLPINLEEIGADYYVGNLHKWLFAPRGCAFIYVQPKHHDWTYPLVVSHNHFEDTLADRFLPSATRDNTPYLVVPECIDFHNSMGGLSVIYERNQALVTAAQEMLAAAWGTEVYPVAMDCRAPFLGLVRVPKILEDNFPVDSHSAKLLMKALCDKGAFVAFTPSDGRMWARIAAHVWNSMEDYQMVCDLVLEMTQEVAAIKKIDLSVEH